MRIVIAGAGTIGSHLCAALAIDGQDIVVIDSDRGRLDGLENRIDCQLIEGDAMSPAVLDEAGIRSVDMVVAVTNSDSLNMAICQSAAYYGVSRKIARLRHPAYTAAQTAIPSSHFGIDHVISPEHLTACQIEQLVHCPGAREAFDFENGRVCVRAMVVTDESPLANERLMDIKPTLTDDHLIAAIRRCTDTVIPDGQSTLRIGDTAYLVCAPDALPRLAPAFDPRVRPARKVIIAGAGIATVELARRLREDGIQVTVIEADPKLVSQAADKLDASGVEVLEGQATDLDLLQRAHVETADFFIGLSAQDEANLTGALLFRKYSNGRPIIQINQPHYVDIVESIDLDVVINPRQLAVSSLLRHIRSRHVLSGFKLMGDAVEILQLCPDAGAPITTRSLCDLSLPRGALVVAVSRGRDLTVPSGDFRIAAGDRVLILAETTSVRAVLRLFRKGSAS